MFNRLFLSTAKKHFANQTKKAPSSFLFGGGRTTFSKRGFANYGGGAPQMPPSFSNMGNWALIGLGTAGLISLMLYGRNLSYQRYATAGIPIYQIQEMNFFNPIV